MSSAQVARPGRTSASSMPHWPDGRKTRGLPSTEAVGLMNASLRSLVSDGGSDLPFHFCKAGLGSNRSIWLGAPSMNRKMTFLALAGNCGARGSSGSVAAWASVASRCASAILPMPMEVWRKKSRRVLSAFMLLPHDKFIQIQQHAGHAGPGGALAEPGALLVEIGMQAGGFFVGGLAVERQFIHPSKRAREVTRIHDALRQRLRGFEKDRVIQQIQSLQRRIRAQATAHCHVALRRVEIGQQRVRGAALEINVEAAAIAIFPCALFPIPAAIAQF